MVKPIPLGEKTVAASAVLVIDRWGASTVSLPEPLPGEPFVGVAVAVLFSVPLKPDAVVPPTWKTTVAPAAMLPMASLSVLPLSVGAGALPETRVALVQLTPVGAGRGSLSTTP